MTPPAGLDPNHATIHRSGGRAAWWIVAILTALYASSYVDRYILALLITPITENLGVSDGQMGLLVGAGFALFYAVVGLPIASWLDRYDRRSAVALGVLLWSSLTVASGFVNSFTELLVCRAGVALGEAFLTPAAISMIADLFAREKRAMPTAVYVSVASVMGTGTYVVGAAALSGATVLSPVFGLEPWRLTLMIVGLPGFLLVALLLLTTREPKRRAAEGIQEQASTLALIRYLHRNTVFFASYYVAIGLIVAAGLAAIVWTPTLLVRAHGFEVAEAGYIYGLLALPASFSGVFLWSFFAGRVSARGLMGGPLLMLVAGTLFTLPFAVFGPVFQNATWVLAAAAIAPLGLAAIPPMIALVVQSVSPDRMRARLTALNLLSTSIIGMGVGSFAVPFIASFLPNPHEQIGLALAIFGGFALGVSVCLLWLGFGSFCRLQKENEVPAQPPAAS